uniref:Uncharacterized protein n=1 Tax=Plectus sambesii TaxID=2011161 RepID=A0A914USU5_9BILA
MFKQSTSKPFKGLGELAPMIQDGTFQLITYGLDDAIFTMINHAEGEQFEAMRKAIAAHPPIVIPDIDKVMEKITEDPRLIFPGAFEISVYSQMRDKCSLMFVDDEDIPVMWISIPYQKHSRIGSKVSAAMAGMVDYMLYIGDKYTAHEQNGDKCVGIDNLQEGKNPLALRHYYGLLMVGAVGVGLAIFVLLLEIMVAKWRKNKENDKLALSQRTGYVPNKKTV